MTQRRKKSIVIAMTLVVIFLLLVFNIHKIRFTISMLNLYNQEKKNEAVINNPEVTKKPIIVDNPLQEIIDQENNVEKPADTPIITENPAKPVEPNATPVIDEKKSYPTIIRDYSVKLETLRTKFEGELDSLILQGVKEHAEGSLSSSGLVSKYLSAGSDLEKISDASFENIVNDMENELKLNNYDTSIIKDTKDYYSNFKETKKSDLIRRGMKNIN